MPGIAMYSATKAYIRVFSRALAVELADDGITVMVACPGGIATDLFGLPHAGVNYGFLALGQSAGSLLFPLAAGALGLEAGRHWLAVCAAAAGFVCTWYVKPTGQKTGEI